MGRQVYVVVTTEKAKFWCGSHWSFTGPQSEGATTYHQHYAFNRLGGLGMTHKKVETSSARIRAATPSTFKLRRDAVSLSLHALQRRQGLRHRLGLGVPHRVGALEEVGAGVAGVSRDGVHTT